jgi:GNAT superfamily N-acetyltransferase
MRAESGHVKDRMRTYKEQGRLSTFSLVPLASHRVSPQHRAMDPTTHTSWTPGAIGDIAALHARTYAASHGFGAFFEAKVARELGDFLLRFDAARDLFRCCVRDGRVVGSIALDCGEDPARAHLRWFILDPALRGQGLGRRWLAEAVDQARRVGVPEVHLWTLTGLDAAARLYAEAGFVLDREETADQWGRRVTERRLVLPLRRGPG